MPPKQQQDRQDQRAEFKPGIVTCQAAVFHDECRLSFIVQARIALVLDQQSLDDGQVLGLLCEHDVVAASLVELPWVMLPAGSSVRHPKMRDGRISLQRDGWMLTEHTTFGRLLMPLAADRVRRYFDEDLWAKLPVVKVRGKAKAAGGVAMGKPSSGDEPRSGEAMLPSRRATEEAARLEAEQAKARQKAESEEAERREAERRKAERREAERREAERREAERAERRAEEAERREAERAERRAEAEAAKVAAAAATTKTAMCREARVAAAAERREAMAAEAAKVAETAAEHGGEFIPKSAAVPKPAPAAPVPRAVPAEPVTQKTAKQASKPAPAPKPVVRKPVPKPAPQEGLPQPQEADAESEEDEELPFPIKAVAVGKAKAAFGYVREAGAMTMGSAAPSLGAMRLQGADGPTDLAGKGTSARLAAMAKKPPIKLVERVKAPQEPLDAHLRLCSGEHWKVVHDFVFLRAHCSTTAEQLGVLRKGAIFCLAATPGVMAEARSTDGKWVRCSQEAKVWPKVETLEPEFLLKNDPNHKVGFVLIRNEAHGDLLRLVPNTQKAPDQPQVLGPKDPLKQDGQTKDNGKPHVETEPKAKPVTAAEMAKLEHWVVESPNATAHASRDEESNVEITLSQGDLINVGGMSWNRMWSDPSGRKWLLFPPGGQIYHNLQPRFPQGGSKKSAYILVQDAETVLVREYTPPETGVTIRLVAGYGERWAVQHEQVVVRRGPSTADVLVGIMLKGDIVGVRRKRGDWVELMHDTDVRFRKKGATSFEPGSTFLSSINPVRERKLDEATIKRWKDAPSEPLAVTFEPRSELDSQAWMLVEHASLGHLLRQEGKRKASLKEGAVISTVRQTLYREVVNLIHRRIYKENLEGLWDGERNKLPTPESIENKLFDSQASVVHVTSAGKFCGGAIIKEICVRAKQVEGSTNLNLSGHPADGDDRPGWTTVGYIDSCAAEPGTGGGRLIWDTVQGMGFVCLTCHSILLQKTVDFWQARGMRRLDPSKQQDCEEFRKNILVHTMGKVILELTDVEKELPSSKLPLFVWVPTRFSQVSVDPQGDYIFTPDDIENIYP